MKLNDLKIGAQLRLGLGLILALVLLLGAQAWRQSDILWLQTKGLYDHPFQVRRAIGKLEADVEGMSRFLRDLFLAQNDQETTAALQGIEIKRADAERQFDILSDRYLGLRDDVTALQDDFAKWNALRTETIRLFQAGKTAEAEARIRPDGVQNAQAEVVRSRLQKIDDFTRNKGDQFYQAAMEQNDTLTHQLVAIVTVILLLCVGIVWFLLKGIKDPLKELTVATEQFRQGKLEARSRYASANEFGALSTSFDTMADVIQTELKINEHATQLAGVMLREEEVQAFCRELLKGLLAHTGSQVGAVYFLNEAKTAFEHFESIGLGTGGRAAFSATALEGEFGAALATRQIQRLTEIPADTRFTFATVSGEFKPREILTIPVLADHTVSAVISLASIRAYDASAIRLVNEIWSVLTARVNGVLAFRKIKDLVDKLEQQNRELDAQKRELEAQATEVTEQNTELEMQKRQLDEANRLKSAFLSNMSHELRTPLNSVIALAGVLNRRLAHTIPVEEHGYLEIIERNGKNLLSLINGILDLSRIEAGREEVSVSRFSVRDLADELVAMLEPQALEKKIALLNQVPAKLPFIASDAVKCRHILQNLLGNAVKFTEQGQVTITAEVVTPKSEIGSSPNSAIRNPQSAIHIVVSDTGIGIAADQFGHIFEEFRQADDSTSRKYGGTGLGLAIAKRYALLLGGDITVASTSGKGSTFTLRLPLALALPGTQAETTWPTAERAARPTTTPSGQGQNILVVEDNEPAIIQLTDILRAEGYRVQVARNGQEALAQIAQTPPDAIILDLMMPGVDGFQVLKTIRSAERTAHLPVLILTAKHVTKEELSFLKGNNIHQLIQKGDINKAGLLAAVARMVTPPTAEPIPTPPRRRRRPTRPGKPVVLVVEDNPDNLRTAHALLNDHYLVIEAANGQAGIEQARGHQPDLILTDIALPGMDGIALLAAIRADESLCDTPVVAVTASAMKGNREEILARGFDAYISKPIEYDTLMKTIQELLH
ncbi:MAG: response regulator [Verrucomicrobiota bacterium]